LRPDPKVLPKGSYHYHATTHTFRRRTIYIIYTALSTLNPIAGIEKAELLRHRVNSYPDIFDAPFPMSETH